MKPRRSYLAAALLVLTLGACTKRPAQPVFTTLAVDSLLCGEGFSCRIEYRFASIANAQGHPALEAVEESNIAYFFELEAFSGSASEAADTAITQIVKEFVAPVNTAVSDGVFERPGWEGEISVESEGRVVDSLLCYTITRSSYTGGAHGMYSTEHHTYSLADGFELSLADLFDARQIEFLDRAIRGKIAMKYDAADDKELSDLGFFPEYIRATENFLVTPEGITFSYDPYDIGCYALGSIEVTFSFPELEELFSAR